MNAQAGRDLRPHGRLRSIVVSVLLVTLPTASLAVQVVYDEAVWTKALWASWKIPNPLEMLNPVDELPRLLKAAPGLQKAAISSLDGPVWLRAPHHEPGGTSILNEVEALEDPAFLEPASQAAQCSVCHTLLSRAWAWASREVLNGAEVGVAAVQARMVQSCEKEVVDVLLHKHTIYKLESDGGATSFMFFVIRDRRPGQQQTSAERQAVRLSCKNLVKELGADMAKVLTDALGKLEFHVKKARAPKLAASAGGGSGGGAAAAAAAAATPGGIGAVDLSGSGGVANAAAVAGGGVVQDAGAGRAAAVAAAVLGAEDDEDEYEDPDDEEVDEEEDEYGDPDDEEDEEQKKPQKEQAPKAAKGKRRRQRRRTMDAGGGATGQAGAARRVRAAGGGGSGAALGERVGGAAAGDAAAVAAGAGAGAAGVRTGPRNGEQLKAIVQRAARALGLDMEIKWPEEMDMSAFDSAGGLDGDQDDENEDACLDLHAKCEQWADIGECDKNPVYMVGTGTSPGHCRKACGLCTPSAPSHPPPAAALDAALATQLSALSAALLQGAKHLACGASRACLTGVSGIAVGGTGALVKQERASGGFVLGKPFYGRAALRPTPIGGEQPLAPVPPAGGPGGAAGAEGAAESAEALLRRTLTNFSLVLQTEFFVYEYIYRVHVRQVHEEEKGGRMTEDWSLGRFQRESTDVVSQATGAPAVLEDLDMLPDAKEKMRGKAWPYIKQVYNKGDECVLAGGRRVVRRTEVRLACSPDMSAPYVLVREPDFCTYVMVIYLPQLCSLEAYAPRPRALLP